MYMFNLKGEILSLDHNNIIASAKAIIQRATLQHV